MRVVERINALALGVIIWIVLILSVLQFTAFNLDFYREQYNSRGTAESIGVSDSDLILVTEVLLDYTSGQREDLNVVVSVNGVMQNFYNQREVDHMIDVRVLYMAVLQIRDILLIFGFINLLSLVLMYKKKTIPLLQFGLTWVSVAFGTVLLVLGTFAILDFDTFWTAFHKVFFSNDLWLLDPYTDNLVNLVPERFFIDLIMMIFTHFSLALLTLFTLLQGLKDKGINQNMLKVIALVTMTIDHVGYFIFPEIRELRIIGRMAYPIFTYLFAISYRYTHNRNALLLRLTVFALVGHALIYLAGDTTFYNILFLFILGWGAYRIIDQDMGMITSSIAVLLLAWIAELIGIDYGAYGILTLVFFYIFHDSKTKQFLAFGLLTIAYSFQGLAFNLLTQANYGQYLPRIFGQGMYSLTQYFPQLFAILALIPLGLYVYKAPKNKTSIIYRTQLYFYYAYYPIHFAILAYLYYHL